MPRDAEAPMNILVELLPGLDYEHLMQLHRAIEDRLEEVLFGRPREVQHGRS